MQTSFLHKTIYYAIALIGLNSVICIHELGHYTFCKLFGVATPLFSIGFGPPIISKEIDQTRFTISALPLGGYVAIKGMDSATSDQESDNFNVKPYWQKLLILLGGILFNLIFGFAILFLTTSTKHSLNFGRSGLIGPIGILQAIADSVSHGPSSLMSILAILSINIGLFNLLPLPILDGGQLLITTIETISSATITSFVKQIISILTWIFFAYLILFTSTKDIISRTKK